MKFTALAQQRMTTVLALLLLSLARIAGAAETAAVESRMLANLKFLAGDKCEGRGILTKGINLAADHIAQELRAAGLKPATADASYFQPFSVPGVSQLGTPNQLVLHGPQGQRIALDMGKHFAVVPVGSAGKLSAPLVFASYGVSAKEPNYDDYQGLDVAGKVVVVVRRTPQYGNTQTGNFARERLSHGALVSKASNAATHKAAAIIFVNDNQTAAADDRLMDFDELAQERRSTKIPALHLRRSYVNMMIRSTMGSDLSEIERAIDRDLQPRSRVLDGWSCDLETTVKREDVPVKNVVGVIEGLGSLANETVIIGAHYDHLGYGGAGSLARGVKSIHYGADDNASGTVTLMELARRFGAAAQSTAASQGGQKEGRRRLVFIAFTAEESGLLGSLHYCKEPLFPIDNTVAMVNMDMVGRLRDDQLTVYGTATAKNFTHLMDDLNQRHKLKLNKVGGGLNPSFGSSDHYSFYMKNIPVIFFFTGMHQQYHRPTDTVDTVNVPGMRRIADLAEETIKRLSTEPRPQFVKLPSLNPFGGRRPAGGGPRLGVMPSYGDEKDGMLIEGVTDGGLAAKHGLKAQDRIVEISGKPVKDVETYMTVMAGFKKGDTIELKVIRQGKPQTFKIALE